MHIGENWCTFPRYAQGAPKARAPMGLSAAGPWNEAACCRNHLDTIRSDTWRQSGLETRAHVTAVSNQKPRIHPRWRRPMPAPRTQRDMVSKRKLTSDGKWDVDRLPQESLKKKTRWRWNHKIAPIIICASREDWMKKWKVNGKGVNLLQQVQWASMVSACSDSPHSSVLKPPFPVRAPGPPGPSFTTGPLLLGVRAQVAHSLWPVMGSPVSRRCRPSPAVFARTCPVEFSEGALPHWNWEAVACEPWDPGNLPHQRWEMRSWLHPFSPRSRHPSLDFSVVWMNSHFHLSSFVSACCL